jgi:hypothetical protein
MTPQEAIPLVEALANGIDPATGVALPAGTPLDDPQVIRALFLAVKALHEAIAWSSNEDERLIFAVDLRIPFPEIAEAHQRSVDAISARLIHLRQLQRLEPTNQTSKAEPDDSFHIEGMCGTCSGG